MNCLPKEDARAPRPHPAAPATPARWALLLALALATAIPSLAQSNSPPPALDLSSFKIISQRNIFNPNRYAYTGRSRPRDTQPRARSEYVALVGTMSYEKGTVAFFDGTSPAYCKAAKPDDTIVGYTLKDIQPNLVKLAVGTNQFDLPIGKELRRQQGGEWVVADRSESYSSAPVQPLPAPAASATNPPSAAVAETNANGEPELGMIPGDEPPPPPDAEFQPGTPNPGAEPAAEPGDPVLLRLMQRRQQEENR